MMPTGSLEEELQGAQHHQFGQVLRDLGIGYIAAHSPQAKGRVERLWRPSRIGSSPSCASTRSRHLAAAEAFLPTDLADHNRRFAASPGRASGRLAPAAPGSRRAAQRPPYPHRGPCNTVRLSPRWAHIPRGPHGAPTPGAASRSANASTARRLVDHPGPAAPPTAPAPAGDLSDPPAGAQRLRAPSQERSEEGGRSLPLHQNRASSARAALVALAQIRAVPRAYIPGGDLRRRQRDRRRQETLPPDGWTFSLGS